VGTKATTTPPFVRPSRSGDIPHTSRASARTSPSASTSLAIARLVDAGTDYGRGALRFFERLRGRVPARGRPSVYRRFLFVSRASLEELLQAALEQKLRSSWASTSRPQGAGQQEEHGEEDPLLLRRSRPYRAGQPTRPPCVSAPSTSRSLVASLTRRPHPSLCLAL